MKKDKNLTAKEKTSSAPPPAVSRKRKAAILVRLWKYLYRYKWLLFSALFLTVVGNGLSLIGPYLSRYAIDAIQLGKGSVNFDEVIYYTSLMLAMFVASSIMSYLLSVIMIKLSRSVVYAMRRDVFNKLASLPVSFFDKKQTGEIISIISYDIDTINTSLSSDAIQILTSIITIVGSLVMMLILLPQLVLIFAITIPASTFFTTYMSKKVRPLYRKRSEKLGALNGYIEEITGGQKTVKAYGREEVMIDRFDVKNTEAVDAYYTADYYSGVTGPAVNFVNNFSFAAISIVGSIMFMTGAITSLGIISSFVQYSRKFSGPINELANIISELQSAFAAAERVFNLLDQKPELEDKPDAEALESVRGEVSIQDLSFGYEPDKIIIKDMNLLAKPGTVVAIVGPTGAGKTTIINLLMRFYDADGGSISVDGKDIIDVTRASLRRSFTMVLQDTWLFYGTVYENIAYGKEGATLEEVQEAAKAAKIHNYIMALPNGYDTVLTDNGVNISKGQKQLMTIARAMLLDSQMLILDEATSNVDTQTERRIQDAMLKLMQNKTCFVIAHRLSTIQNADIILVLSNGEIVEQGTHERLMEKQGEYFRLYYSQYDES